MSKQNNTNKLTSGRLWLTIICGLSFFIFTITICQVIYMRREILSGSELVSVVNVLLLIVSNVMTFYFTKNREDSVKDKKDFINFVKQNNDQPETEEK